MYITSLLTDIAVLEELGRRVQGSRLARNLTQERLAEEAGVTPPTIAKLEHGRPVQLITLIRVLRVLDLLDGFDAAVPAPAPRPVDQLRRRRRERRRASTRRQRGPSGDAGQTWRWGDEAGGGG